MTVVTVNLLALSTAIRCNSRYGATAALLATDAATVAAYDLKKKKKIFFFIKNAV